MKNTFQIHFFIAFLTLASNVMYGQFTPKDLGNDLFQAFESDSLELILSHTPPCDLLLEKTIADGTQMSSSEKKRFCSHHSDKLVDMEVGYNRVYNEGIRLGIEWSEAQLATLVMEEVPCVSNDAGSNQQNASTVVHILFTYKDKKYSLDLKELIEIDHYWYVSYTAPVLLELQN